MIADNSASSILIIDDEQDSLETLHSQLRLRLPASDYEIRTWKPSSSDNPREHFLSLVDETTVLVATDLDLTKNGLRGLYGHSIVAWCHEKFIPVGDYSRAPRIGPSTRPDLLDLQLDPDSERAAKQIACLGQGFTSLYKLVHEVVGHPEKDSLANVLASVLQRPSLEGEFSLYFEQLGSAGGPVSKIQDGLKERKVDIISYFVGHVLYNLVLKYPGPLLSSQALCSYFATCESEKGPLAELFDDARYRGPFASGRSYFWREDIDQIVDEAAEGVEAIDDSQAFGTFNRSVAESLLQRGLAAHKCRRDGCEGMLGGFWCPFTERTVCQREDCSVTASDWLPQGASISRVERDFYLEWSPLYGY